MQQHICVLLKVDGKILVLPSSKQAQSSWETLFSSLNNLHCNGISIDWSSLHHDYHASMLELPTYHFDYKNLWFDQVVERSPQFTALPTLHDGILLGERLRVPGTEVIRFEADIYGYAPGELKDHKIFSNFSIIYLFKIEIIKMNLTTALLC